MIVIMTDKIFWRSLKLEIDAIYLVGCCMKNSFASLETFYHVAYEKLLTRFPEIKPHVYHVMASSLFCLSTWKLFHKYKQTWKSEMLLIIQKYFSVAVSRFQWRRNRYEFEKGHRWVVVASQHGKAKIGVSQHRN